MAVPIMDLPACTYGGVTLSVVQVHHRREIDLLLGYLETR